MCARCVLGGLCRQKRTRLCRWIVYSRATTSEMAERVMVGFLAPGLDLGAIRAGWIDGG